jgi:Transcription factor subunit Med10 of Mediator complex
MERYVEDGLNPDKYTRRFVNMLMKDNQFVNGKIDAVQVNHPEDVSNFRIFGMCWPRKFGRSFLS